MQNPNIPTSEPAATGPTTSPYKVPAPTGESQGNMIEIPSGIEPKNLTDNLTSTVGQKPELISDVPITDEQRADADAKREADAAARAKDAEVYHGGYTGSRISQMPGAVGGPIRIDTDRNPRHGDPQIPRSDVNEA